jgi:hypothetical protein
MRSLGTRRVALFASAATVAAVALAGCSAGQVAETSLKRPSNQGVNAQSATGSVLIRNLAVGYNGTAGYQPGADAPIEGTFFNQTNDEITVKVSSAPPLAGGPASGVVVATAITLTGDPSASPSASAAPAATPAAPAPAEIKIPANGTVSFLAGDTETLEATGLNGKLVPGNQLSLLLQFSDGSADLHLLPSVATPLSPAPRGSGLPGENSEE